MGEVIIGRGYDREENAVHSLYIEDANHCPNRVRLSALRSEIMDTPEYSAIREIASKIALMTDGDSILSAIELWEQDDPMFERLPVALVDCLMDYSEGIAIRHAMTEQPLRRLS